MSKRLIIFGTGQTAELAKYYIDNDTSKKVEAFTVERGYLNQKEFEGRPVVCFEDILENYNTDDFELFAPITAIGMNQFRERVFKKGKSMGFDFFSYVSSKAQVFTEKIGENCFILENNTIQPKVRVGHNCVFWSGNHLGHHSSIGDNCFFTSQVVLSGNCIVGRNCFFGVNSTIRDFSNIGEGTLLAMGSCLMKKSTEPWSVYSGSPAVRNNKRKSTDFI